MPPILPKVHLDNYVIQHSIVLQSLTTQFYIAVSNYTVLYCQIEFYTPSLFFLCHSVEYLSFPLNFVFFLPVGC